MTAPAEAPASEPANEAPPATPAAPSPANMPQSQPPVAAAPTVEKPEEGTGEPVESPELAKVRREAAKYRTERNQLQEQQAADKAAREKEAAESASLKDVLAKLNAVLNPDANAPADPEKLLEQLSAAEAKTAKVEADYQAKIRDLSIRAALPGALTKAQADPGLTEAVLTASGALGKLDPSSDTFATDLASAVNDAIEANPRLKVEAPAARSPRSGAEIPGRSGGSTQLTLDQVRAMKPDEINKARKEGRLTSLGIGPG